MFSDNFLALSCLVMCTYVQNQNTKGWPAELCYAFDKMQQYYQIHW